MSKSDPPQVQTDSLKEEADEMIAEESIADPVSWNFGIESWPKLTFSYLNFKSNYLN